MLAETQYQLHRLSGYNCLVEFKAYAGDEFTKFNGRQKQQIINQALAKEFDLEHLKHNAVVLDSFPLHTDMKRLVIKSWSDHRFSLLFGFVTGFW